MQTVEISDAAFNKVMSRRLRPGESISTIILREMGTESVSRCIICDEVKKAKSAPSTEWRVARKKLGLN